MEYEGRMTASNGATKTLTFDADSNELASAHIAHYSTEPLRRAVGKHETWFGWNMKPEGVVEVAEFRRYYAEKWITSVHLPGRV